MTYTEKEILSDALEAEKTATDHYNMYANECVHDDLRQTILLCLAEEHDIQKNVFNEMHTRGFYPTPAAEESKVKQVQQKYESCVTSL